MAAMAAILDFWLKRFFAISDLQVKLMLPTKFQAKWLFGSGGEAKINFQERHEGGHFGLLIGKVLSIFDLQITLMFPTKFQVNCSFGSGEEAKNS